MIGVDIEMPKRCEECLFYDHKIDGGCEVTKYFVLRRKGEDRPNWCPLTQITESTMGQLKPKEGVNEALRHALRADQTWAEYTLQNERKDEVEE